MRRSSSGPLVSAGAYRAEARAGIPTNLAFCFETFPILAERRTQLAGAGLSLSGDLILGLPEQTPRTARTRRREPQGPGSDGSRR